MIINSNLKEETETGKKFAKEYLDNLINDNFVQYCTVFNNEDKDKIYKSLIETINEFTSKYKSYTNKYHSYTNEEKKTKKLYYKQIIKLGWCESESQFEKEVEFKSTEKGLKIVNEFYQKLGFESLDNFKKICRERTPEYLKNLIKDINKDL